MKKKHRRSLRIKLMKRRKSLGLKRLKNRRFSLKNTKKTLSKRSLKLKLKKNLFQLRNLSLKLSMMLKLRTRSLLLKNTSRQMKSQSSLTF